MFDIGGTEMLVIAVVLIVIVGPKDLPRMLRTFGQTTKKLRSMAGDFQKQFNDALKEAELDDVKKSVDALKGLNPTAEIKKQLNPFEKAASDVKSGLDSAMKPKPTEPLKPGATAVPGAGAPEATPAHPESFPAMADPAAAKPAAVPPAGNTASAMAAPKPVKPKPAKPASVKTAAAKPAAAKSPAAAKAAKPATAKKKPAGSAK